MFFLARGGPRWRGFVEWLTVRLLTINRRARPAVVGGGLVALCAAVAATMAAVSGGPASPAGALRGLARAEASAAAPARPARTPTAAEGGAESRAILTGATTPRLIVPDVIASVPGGVTAADLKRLRALPGVRAVLAIDGAKITVNGAQLTVLAADASALRPWTPPATASDARVWSDLAAGDLITSAAAARSAGLVSGSRYPATAATSTRLTVGTQALLGIAGVDGIVDRPRGGQLGLARNIAVLVNAPATSPLTLVSQVSGALGVQARVIRLVPAKVSTSLPVVAALSSSGRPDSYIELFKESAARYCPGLSWTVLAAIGQIESADGQNMGPSTAGALGPMQFLPSTWRTWGIDGFGDTGQPNIMNPFDAVPSAARLLCADGAASGSGLRAAIFDYNHATWYVNEVLTLAEEYAAEF
jgi:hypothetical protein